ncbi:MAG: cellulase family glycosylhydrolase [candidate division KSB1 bacterium]|nr:cellulase family glycosylhydrolase [candidate division KSB1 bacterium]MDZ7345349.1 cellulase family glycosylhydrolase [candidate division KSB1 bacterium]
MKKLVWLLSVTCVLLTLGCARLSRENPKTLRVQGRDIVDRNGKRVILRAVGLGNYLLPEGYMWKFGKNGDRPRRIEKLIVDMIGEQEAKKFWRQFRANYITEADVARIKELGFNAVRPAVNWRVLMNEESGKLEKEGFQLLDNLVKWCTKHGVYVIIDMHGAPGGQTGSNIDDSRNDFPELFTDPAAQERLITLWRTLAKRYAREPFVVAYDLLNEPLPEQFKQFYPELEPLYRRIVAAIRQVDPYTMITLEGAHWANDFSIFGPPFDSNTFYQFHKYWSTPDTKSLQPYLEFREKYNVPLWCGESGENNNDWYWAAYQLYEDHNIGWLFWPWKKMDTKNTPYSIKRPEGWDKIVEFSRGGEKPSAEEALRSLNQLLENVKLENCDFFPDVVQAVFRRVPARIQAENYGHEGEGLSYALLDPTGFAKVYRPNEPVPIVELPEESEHDRKAYGVVLQADEWLAYPINSAIDQVLKVMVKARAETQLPDMHIELDGKKIALGRNYYPGKFYFNFSVPFVIPKGSHEIKLVVDEGKLTIDWFELQ